MCKCNLKSLGPFVSLSDPGRMGVFSEGWWSAVPGTSMAVTFPPSAEEEPHGRKTALLRIKRDGIVTLSITLYEKLLKVRSVF